MLIFLMQFNTAANVCHVNGGEYALQCTVLFFVSARLANIASLTDLLID